MPRHNVSRFSFSATTEASKSRRLRHHISKASYFSFSRECRRPTCSTVGDVDFPFARVRRAEEGRHQKFPSSTVAEIRSRQVPVTIRKEVEGRTGSDSRGLGLHINDTVKPCADRQVTVHGNTPSVCILE